MTSYQKIWWFNGKRHLKKTGNDKWCEYEKHHYSNTAFSKLPSTSSLLLGKIPYKKKTTPDKTAWKVSHGALPGLHSSSWKLQKTTENCKNGRAVSFKNRKQNESNPSL